MRRGLEEDPGEPGNFEGCDGRLEGENLHFPAVFNEPNFFPDYLKDFFCGDREKCVSLNQKPKTNRLLRKRKNEFVDGRFHASILKPAENLHYSSVAF